MAKNNGNGNGDAAIKTLEEIASLKTIDNNVIRLGQLARQDGLIAESIDKSAKQGQGVIQSVLSANDDEEERQILKHALWKSQEQRNLYVIALSHLRLTGATNARQTLLDLITANSAGDNGWLITESYHALNHTSIMTGSSNDGKRRIFGGNSGANATSSGSLTG